MECTLIANSGIHLITVPLELDVQEKFKMWFHEWYDTSEGEWKLELAEQVNFEEGTVYYKKQVLREKGYLTSKNIAEDYLYSDLKEDGVFPIADEEGMLEDAKGEIFKLTFSDKNNLLERFENVWLPAPYFMKRSEKKFFYGPFNWARFKLVPENATDGSKKYTVLLAFDTRSRYQSDEYNEYPVFPDAFEKALPFELCTNEAFLMDYCSPAGECSYIDKYLMKLAHPDIQRISQIKGQNVHRLAYIASYVFLVDFIAQHHLFPSVTLYKDTVDEEEGVDMLVDIGNSRTTVLLVEDNTTFNQVPKLKLTDFTMPLARDENGQSCIRRHGEPFDMRLAFRKAQFGNFGITGSKQFVYPSFVRLGEEANELMHLSSENDEERETLSTYSSPKRYLWDNRPNREEWRFLTLPGEEKDNVLYIKGLSDFIKSNGRFDTEGIGGTTYDYPRRTLMTFSFLEMIVQARTQLNSPEHRAERGKRHLPRRIKRMIITCPTAMSKMERESLICCARDAVSLLCRFDENEAGRIEIVPQFTTYKDSEPSWYYDEATCAQLVYMYGEVGYKYKGACSEFFNLYGKKEAGDTEQSLMVASLDIGAGTSDLMISKYTYTKDVITRITPSPQFYDSFYYAGDDMLEALTKQIMYMSEDSAIRKQMPQKSFEQFQQSMKDFVGPDYHGQTIQDRLMRRDFNLQYSLPLMYRYLELVGRKSKDCTIHYSDVFKDCPPNQRVMDYFENRFGFSLTKLEWEFNYKKVCQMISREFEPLLRKVAAIIFAYSCDIVLISGRPASLSPIRELLLKYYCVSPDRLILLNNYYVGDWYPYDDNTGYIADPKTVVSVGAAVAHYSSELSNLNHFVIETDKLKENLKSTVNYIESGRDGVNGPVSYLLTPKVHTGTLSVSALPMMLKVRQVGKDSYPARSLYTIDFEWGRLALRAEQQEVPVNRLAELLKARMPFTLTIERDPDDKETLSITSIIDKNGNDVPGGLVDIHIQSLGADEKYWLDSGVFFF